MFLVLIVILIYDIFRFVEFEDFLEILEFVWILGRKYSIFIGISRVGVCWVFSV